MQYLALVLMAALVTLVGTLKVRELLRWTRTRATFLGLPNAWSYTGQKLPIAFTLDDGTEVRSTLRLFSRAGPPAVGTQLDIVYDPADPSRAEWAAAIFAIAAGSLIAAAFAATIAYHWLWG